MKKIITLVSLAVLSSSPAFLSANQEAKQTGSDKATSKSGLNNFLKPKTTPVMSLTTSDGKCPIVGITWFGSTPIAQYPPTSVDPDCPPN